jgi:hypothetical protein
MSSSPLASARSSSRLRRSISLGVESAAMRCRCLQQRRRHFFQTIEMINHVVESAIAMQNQWVPQFRLSFCPGEVVRRAKSKAFAIPLELFCQPMRLLCVFLFSWGHSRGVAELDVSLRHLLNRWSATFEYKSDDQLFDPDRKLTNAHSGRVIYCVGHRRRSPHVTQFPRSLHACRIDQLVGLGDNSVASCSADEMPQIMPPSSWLLAVRVFMICSAAKAPTMRGTRISSVRACTRTSTNSAPIAYISFSPCEPPPRPCSANSTRRLDLTAIALAGRASCNEQMLRCAEYGTHTLLLTPQKNGSGPCAIPMTLLRQACSCKYTPSGA